MTVEEILVRLGVDTKTARAGMEGMKDYLLDWARAMRTAIVGAFALEGVKEVFEKNIEYGEKIYDLSHRLAISAVAVQAWDYALKKTGSSIDAASGFFEKLAAAREKAMQGETQTIVAFKELGVTLDDLKSKRIEDIAEQIGAVFKAGGDPQALIGALRQVGGRGAGEMIPALVNGIKEARDEAQKLGLILSDDVIAKLKEAGVEWTQMVARLRSATAPWVAEMVEGFDVLLYSMKGLFNGLVKFIETFFKVKNTHDGTFVQAIKAAAADFQDEENKVWEEMIAADKARKQAAGQAKPVTVDERNDVDAIKNIRREIAETEEKAKLKVKTTEEQIQGLYKTRNDLINSLDDKSLSKLDREKIGLDIAKNHLAIATLEDELNKANAKREKDLADAKEKLLFLEQRRVENLLAPAQSSIDEIAKSGWWSRQSGFSGGRWHWQQGQFAGIAQEIERLQMDAKNSLLYYDNKDRASEDLSRAGVLRGKLEDAGLVSPERRLESIDEEIKRLNKTIGDGSGSIQVGNGP